jgi:hypothetical protein
LVHYHNNGVPHFVEPFPHVIISFFLANFCHKCGFDFTCHRLIVFGSACVCSSCSAVCHPWCVSLGTKKSGLELQSCVPWQDAGRKSQKPQCVWHDCRILQLRTAFKLFQIGCFCGNHGLPKIRHSKLRHQKTNHKSILVPRSFLN